MNAGLDKVKHVLACRKKLLMPRCDRTAPVKKELFIFWLSIDKPKMQQEKSFTGFVDFWMIQWSPMQSWINKNIHNHFVPTSIILLYLRPREHQFCRIMEGQEESVKVNLQD